MAADQILAILERGEPLPATQTAERADDRALVKALVLGTLRHLAGIDAAINASLDRPLRAKAARTKAILRIMAAQLLVLDMPDHAAVTCAVDDAGRRKDSRPLKGLVNAVGRRMIRERDTLQALCAQTLPDDWLARRWQAHYGQETAAAMLRATAKQPALDLSFPAPGQSAGDVEPETLLADAKPVRLNATTLRLANPGRIEDLPGYRDGHWWVQDVAAALPVTALLNALPDPASARVLDLCAAPGGKTAQLAKAGCSVTAIDQSSRRMAVLKTNMARLRLDVTCHVADALDFQADEPFDAVVLDAPCSATGTLRRHPEIRHLRTDQDVAAMATVQRALLDHAATLVTPSGLLAYITCSLEPEEGEDQIAWFLARHPGWSIEPIAPKLCPPGAVRADGTLRTLPSLSAFASDKRAHQAGEAGDLGLGMDGFFAALLRAPDAPAGAG